MTRTQKAGQTIAKQVPAATEGKETVDVESDGTIEALKLRVYSGAENTLRLRPQIDRRGHYEDIISYGGKSFVDGDDDVWEWDLSVPIEAQEEIVIRHDNTDGSNAHNYRATVDVDYWGGTRRAISAFRGLFSSLPGGSG